MIQEGSKHIFEVIMLENMRIQDILFLEMLEKTSAEKEEEKPHPAPNSNPHDTSSSDTRGLAPNPTRLVHNPTEHLRRRPANP